MALEVATYINDLVVANPPGTDLLAQADDHIRLNKTVNKNTFAGFAGAVIVTGTDTGAANAYVLTPATALPSYVNGMLCIFTPTNVNTGAATVNISGLGVKSIKKTTGAALAAGDLPVSYPSLMQYNGTDFILIGGAGLAMKTYVDGLAFAAALPAQVGNADKLVTTDGTTASWASDLKSTLRLVDSTDTTKKVAFALSGLTTATTRTYTAPDKSGTLAMTSDLTPAGWTLLSTINASGAATVDVETTFSSTYDAYVIVASGVTLSTGGNLVSARMKLGGAYDTGANYSYHGNNPVETSSAYAGFIGTGTTSIPITGSSGVGGGSTVSLDFIMEVFNPSSTAFYKQVMWRAIYINGVNGTLGITGFGKNSTASALTGIRFFAGAGNLSGSFRLYGVTNT